jgi:hypothetical protein
MPDDSLYASSETELLPGFLSLVIAVGGSAYFRYLNPCLSKIFPAPVASVNQALPISIPESRLTSFPAVRLRVSIKRIPLKGHRSNNETGLCLGYAALVAKLVLFGLLAFGDALDFRFMKTVHFCVSTLE